MSARVSAVLLLLVLVTPGMILSSEHSSTRSVSESQFVTAPQIHFDNYTIYSDPISPTLMNVLNSYLGQWNLKPIVYGNLIHVSIPSTNSTHSENYIQTLSRTFGFSFFLDNQTVPIKPFSVGSVNPIPAATVPVAYLPKSIYKAYNYTSANTRGIEGNNTTIVVIDAYGDPNLYYDVSVFDNYTGLPPVSLTVHYLNVTPLQYNLSWAQETALDVEWAHASAPGAKIVLLIAGNALVGANTGPSLSDALSYAVTDGLGNVISLSWGAPETKMKKSDLATLNGVYSQAYREGITVLAASGDGGGYDGTPSPAVNYPASDPYVTGVGGTSLTPRGTQYEESAWGGSTAQSTFGSGGGYSIYFNTPYWQSAVGFNNRYRGVPDVSAIANPGTGVLEIFNGSMYQAGGTSLSTPIWAGIVSRMDQYAGKSLGFLNPFLYQITRAGLYDKAFNQVNTGSNGVYSATSGWDPVTGLGTPDLSGLLSSYSRVTGEYGFVVTSNYSFNSTGIETNMSIPHSSNISSVNGTAVYYVSAYLNSENYFRLGLALNKTGVYVVYSFVSGNSNFSKSVLIQAAPYSAFETHLSLSWKGYYVNLSAGNFSSSLRLFIPFIGSALPALGTAVLGSQTNLTRIPEVDFSNISVMNNSKWNKISTLYESHFSSLATIPTYSSVSGVFNNGSITAMKTTGQVNGELIGSSINPIHITYDIAYKNPVVVHLNLSGIRTASLQWLVNGSIIPGNKFIVSRSGFYNLTAEYSKSAVYRTVYIENTSISAVDIYNPVSGYTTNITLTANYLQIMQSNIGDLGTLHYTSIAGLNHIQMQSRGYKRLTVETPSSVVKNVTLVPLKATVTLFVSPGSAEVTINSNNVIGHKGYFVSTITPGSFVINLSKTSYVNYSKEMFAAPGTRIFDSIQLIPEKSLNLLEVQGSVRNGEEIFNFPLKGVSVSLNNSVYTYSNSTGGFRLYLPSGHYTLNFSLPYYNDTSYSLNLTGNMSIIIKMVGDKLSSLLLYSPFKPFATFLIFFLLYLSWSSQKNVTSYAVFISTSESFLNSTKLVIPSNQNYAIIPTTPLKTYYIQISAYTSQGKIVSSKTIEISGTSTFSLLINSAIVAGIAIYLAFAIRIAHRYFRRKQTRSPP